MHKGDGQVRAGSGCPTGTPGAHEEERQEVCSLGRAVFEDRAAANLLQNEFAALSMGTETSLQILTSMDFLNSRSVNPESKAMEGKTSMISRRLETKAELVRDHLEVLFPNVIVKEAYGHSSIILSVHAGKESVSVEVLEQGFLPHGLDAEEIEDLQLLLGNIH